MIYGIVLAVIPHFAWMVQTGSPDFLTDGDDVLYTAVARPPYYGEPALRDPFQPPDRRVPTLYSWLQFVPAAWMTRALGLPPERMGLVWRAAGGGLMALSLYVLLRRLVAGTRHPVAWAAGCTLFALSDVGLVAGRPLLDTAATAWEALRGQTPSRLNVIPHLRVVTPLLNFPTLAFMVAALVPVGGRRPAWAVLGAAALGACVQLYFFYWTAAVVGLGIYLGGLGIWWLRSQGEIKAEAWRNLTAGVIVLAGGLLVGAPQITSNTRTFSTPEYKPILERIGRGRQLPAEDPVRWQYVKNYWLLGKLALATVVVVGLGFWRLAPVWAIAMAGFLLANSSIITRLEFENYHWLYVSSPFLEIILLAALALAVDRWSRPAARWPLALAVIALVSAVIAPAIRVYGAMKGPEAVQMTGWLNEFRPIAPELRRLGTEDILAGPFAANVAILFGRSGQLYQFDQSACSSMISQDEVHERHALNGWLMGLGRDEYAETAAKSPIQVGPPDPRRSDWGREEVARARLVIFDRLESGDVDELLSRYRPNRLLRPASEGPPPRGGPWTRLVEDGGWALWGRDMAEGAVGGRDGQPR